MSIATASVKVNREKMKKGKGEMLANCLAWWRVGRIVTKTNAYSVEQVRTRLKSINNEESRDFVQEPN